MVHDTINDIWSEIFYGTWWDEIFYGTWWDEWCKMQDTRWMIKYENVRWNIFMVHDKVKGEWW
jgi:hypothetical protein